MLTDKQKEYNAAYMKDYRQRKKSSAKHKEYNKIKMREYRQALKVCPHCKRNLNDSISYIEIDPAFFVQ